MYEKSVDVKIVRTKHKVTFRMGMEITSLIHELNNVPHGSEVDEVLECVNNDNELYSIEFHEEKKDKP